MKRVWIAFFGIILILNFLSAERIHRNIKENVIRLHIVANSNSKGDQAFKLSVRDYVLNHYGKTLSASNKKEALKAIKASIPAMETDLKQQFKQNIRITLSETDFPTKQYNGVRLPQGNYTALSIKIGAAKGKNWWCIMYPSLCFSDLSIETNQNKMKEVLNDTEFKTVTADKGKVLYKFKAVELWNKFKKLF
ncbi:MAG: stage II sporulation protein R [Clostridia bacterium]|nr:stage II sporulation protein R [Clostridia bacterium]